jgi:hypothetical protein
MFMKFSHFSGHDVLQCEQICSPSTTRANMKPVRKDHQDFAMLTRGYIRDMRELSRRNQAAFQVFMLLAERMNKTNAVVVSQATLCQILGYGRTTIHAAVRLLEAERWLQIVKIGTANGYVINSKVLWRDHSGKRYASFFAEVVVSEAEQSRSIEDWDNVELRHVPVLKPGESIVDDGTPLPPPDQADLIPPDPAEFPHISDAQELAAMRDQIFALGERLAVRDEMLARLKENGVRVHNFEDLPSELQAEIKAAPLMPPATHGRTTKAKA